MTCPKCGMNLADGAAFCSSCGLSLGAAGAPGMAPPPMYGMPPPGYGAPIATRTSGMAIAGFVLSFFCGLLGLIFSIIGHNECKSSNGAVTGDGLAVAGIVISIVSLVIGLAMVAAK